MSRRPILCLDFDGVCHSYKSGWKGADVIPDPPVDGLFEFLKEALEVFEVHVHSSRSTQPGGIPAMKAWFHQHVGDLTAVKLVFDVDKPPAFLTLDDRGWQFNGEFPDVQELLKFKPWNKR